VEKNEANCRKVNAIGSNDKMAIATEEKVPLSSVNFIGARWQSGRYGGMSCIFIFDTAKGPKRCEVIALLSDDNGKTTFGVVAPSGIAGCY